MDNDGEASKDFDETIIINSDYSRAYLNRGWIKFKNKQYEEAIIDFDHAIRIEPHSAISFYHRGCAKLNLERFHESIKDFDHAPNDANTHNNRGVAKERLKLWSEAQLDYQKALEIDPNNEVAKNYLKNLETKMKQTP
ncbi:MAG: tetratricopeptide repeat protein [Saprospiraceae bacterium]